MGSVFDSVPGQSRPLDGLMGNQEFNDFELDHIRNLLARKGHFGPGESVLDAGCGMARCVPLLRDAGFRRIAAVDFSLEMLKAAAAAEPDAEYRRADLTALPFDDDEFDCAFVMYVLVHIMEEDRLDAALSELERVTKGDILIGQNMDARLARQEFKQVKIREVFDLVTRFTSKKLKRFYKDLYEIPIGDERVKVSFLIMGGSGG